PPPLVLRIKRSWMRHSAIQSHCTARRKACRIAPWPTLLTVPALTNQDRSIRLPRVANVALLRAALSDDALCRGLCRCRGPLRGRWSRSTKASRQSCLDWFRAWIRVACVIRTDFKYRPPHARFLAGKFPSASDRLRNRWFPLSDAHHGTT